jgi:alpha-beta hydrolase superfamily lysophospholipase
MPESVDGSSRAGRSGYRRPHRYTECLSRLRYYRDKFDPLRVRPFAGGWADFETRAADGTRICGTALTSTAPAGAAEWAIVLAHGLFANRRLTSLLDFAESLTRFGPVWTIDLRGHGSSDGVCTLGEDEALDVLAGVAVARAAAASTSAPSGPHVPPSHAFALPAPAGPAPAGHAFALPAPAGPAPAGHAFALPAPAGPAPAGHAFAFPAPAGPAPAGHAFAFPAPAGPAPASSALAAATVATAAGIPAPAPDPGPTGAAAPGRRPVVTIGLSMGAAAAVRAAALAEPAGKADGVIAISCPAPWRAKRGWGFRKTELVWQLPGGRRLARVVTRVALSGATPPGLSPLEAIPAVAPSPVLIVHGTADPFFPPSEAEALYAAAGEPKGLWLIDGGGHAEGLFSRPGQPVVRSEVDAFAAELMARLEALSRTPGAPPADLAAPAAPPEGRPGVDSS